MLLQGQAALVTGASRGIGKEIALELARNGFRVAVNYYNDPGSMVEATVAEIRALGAEVLPIQADIRSSSQVTAMFERVITSFGRLDLLVNNAGVQTWKPLLDVTEEEWDLVVDTNLKGCFLCTQQAGRYMKDHGGGSIVNLGSGCNKLAFPRLVAYTASKGGIEMFTKGPSSLPWDALVPPQTLLLPLFFSPARKRHSSAGRLLGLMEGCLRRRSGRTRNDFNPEAGLALRTASVSIGVMGSAPE